MGGVDVPLAPVWERAGGMGRVIAVTFPGSQRPLEGEEGVESFPGGRRRPRKKGGAAMAFFDGGGWLGGKVYMVGRGHKGRGEGERGRERKGKEGRDGGLAGEDNLAPEQETVT